MIEADRRFKINEWINVFWTGRTNDGHQLLIGIQFPEVVAVLFSRDGDFERILTQHLRETVTNPDTHNIESDLAEMKARLGFRASPIEVKEFFVPDRWIGIRILPEHYEEVLEHPEQFDDDERSILEDQIRQWIERGDFVLYWCEDYYLNRDGEVESS